MTPTEMNYENPDTLEQLGTESPATETTEQRLRAIVESVNVADSLDDEELHNRF